MSLDYLTGQTMQQIALDCERMCNNPGLHLDPATGVEPVAGAAENAFAYRWLNDELQSLYKLSGWPFLETATTLTLPAGTQALTLPDNFYRIQHDTGAKILDGQSRRPLAPVDREVMWSRTTDPTIELGTPERFWIDRIKEGKIYFDPTPSRQVYIELHYVQGQDRLINITDVPLFPDHSYLKLALLLMYYLDQDDSRVTGTAQLKAAKFKALRDSTYDLREPQIEALDRNVFGSMPIRYE